MCVKHSVTYEASICKHNYIEHGGNSICLLRGWTQTQRKAGTRPESWWRVKVRVPSTWVMYSAESSAPLLVHGLIHDASCPLPFTHSWFASNLNWAILAFFLGSSWCVHLSWPNRLSPFFFFPIILSHPRFVSATKTFPPGSIRSMDLEHISFTIHYSALSWGNICSTLSLLTHFYNNRPPFSLWKIYNKIVSKTVFCFFCFK